MTGHCDADALAEFREGLLGRRRSAHIRAHLAQCSSCAATSSGLAEVTALLASAPAPKMPDGLTTRLDRVLAAESAARAQAGTAAAAAPGSNGAARDAAGRMSRRRGGRPGPARSPRPARPWHGTALRAASVTAAVLVIAGGGYGVSRLIQGGGPASGSSASGAAPPRAGAGPTHGLRVPGNGSAGPNHRAPTSLHVIHSGTDYLPGRLAAQAAGVLAKNAASLAVTTPRSTAGSSGSTPAAASSAGGAPRATAGSAGTTAPSASPGSTDLQGCVQLVTGGARLLLVDVAHYQGRPATVIIEAPPGAQPGHVWVVGPGCSAGRSDLITQVPLAGTG